MKVLLVNPPYPASEPPRIPMGLLYIGGAAMEAGHEVEVLDLLVARPDKQAVYAALERFEPEVVGTTSVTMNWHEASGVLRWAREADPSVITVAGGPHVSFTWRQIGRDEPWVDYIVIGEGERTFVEFLETLKEGRKPQSIPGLAWREDGSMRAGAGRKFEPDLEALPYPARHLFPLSRYRAMKVDGGLSTGRGCPFSCTFCVGPKMVGKKPRLKSPKSVADEIEELVAMGFGHIAFSDDHFGMKRSHAMAVSDEITRRGLDIDLSIFIRADAAEPRLLEKMRAAGCSKILYGAESGVQEIVDAAKKKINLVKLKEKVSMALDMDFQVQVTFILGLPGETRDTVARTFEYAGSLGAFYGMHLLAPLPGSEIYERAREMGVRILHEDYKYYDANHTVTETEGLPAAELEKIWREYDEAFDKFETFELEAWKQGKLTGTHLEEFERRRCRNFFWKLFTRGFFDGRECSVPLSEKIDPMDSFIPMAAASAGVDNYEAGRWLKSAVEEGDLIITESGHSARFYFSDGVYAAGGGERKKGA